MAVLRAYVSDKDFETVLQAAELCGISISAFTAAYTLPAARKKLQELWGRPETQRMIILRAIHAGRWKIEELTQVTKWEEAAILVILDELEIDGYVEKVKGSKRGEFLWRPSRDLNIQDFSSGDQNGRK